MSELLKAWKNGKRGKFRRVDGGKLKFIRSDDGKVEKTTDPGFVTDTDSCLCKAGAKCGCGKVPKDESGVVKNESTCDCTHEGVCKDDVNCDCDCTDRATCTHRAETAVEKVDSLIHTLEARLA